MCNPLALAGASAAVGLASSVMGFMGQKQAYADNTYASNISYANSANQIMDERAQIDARQSEQTFSDVVANAQAQGRISASASSMGVGSSTAAELANAADFETGRTASIEQLNSQDQRLNTSSELKDADLRRRSQLAQVQKPSAASLVLGLAKTGLGAATTYHDLGGRF